jgi:phosphate transport system substrate-binding protein
LPLYNKWASVYSQTKGVRVNYQSVGSGAGVQQLSEGTVDFGATDGPMTDAELAQAKRGAILHIPMTLGADVVTYNLPGVTQPLQLSGDVVADIFLGRITKWNDPRITATNAGLSIPARDILVVHRSDGSGTTYVFTDYLSAVSPAWAAGPGRGKAVNWPTGLGGNQNAGVAAQVKQTDGAIGYVELTYALQNNLPAARIRNAAGRFVEPTIASITAAAAGVADTLAATTDFRVSIVDAPGDAAYPISSFTWIILYQNQTDSDKGRKLVEFLNWALTDGQQYAAALHYASLPAAVVAGAQRKLETVKIGVP